MSPIKRNRMKSVVASGLAASVASTVAAPDVSAAVRPKAPGETKIVAIMGGDYGHNSIPLEMHIRQRCRPAYHLTPQPSR